MGRRGRAQQPVDITVSLLTGRVLNFKQMSLNTTTKQLKLMIENECGIPSQCQRLTYLDMCDMFDDRTLEQSDIVDRGRLKMKAWAPFSALVTAASAGHITQVFSAGVINNKGLINNDEAFIALYIAAHGGHLRLVLMLLSYGVNVDNKTQLGRTALHGAGIKGNWSVLCLLINWGANIYQKDKEGQTAMDYARMFGHRECARGLALYQWHLKKEEKVAKSAKLAKSIEPSNKVRGSIESTTESTQSCPNSFASMRSNTYGEEEGNDIMSQFPPHWITDMPGAKVKQVFAPPVTMNLVAARAANMLNILQVLDPARSQTMTPSIPSYNCGKEHAIPGVVALNVQKEKKRRDDQSEPAQPRHNKTAPPDYNSWLEMKSGIEKEKKDREKALAKAWKEEKAQEEAVKKEQSEKAYGTWLKNSGTRLQSMSDSRILQTA